MGTVKRMFLVSALTAVLLSGGSISAAASPEEIFGQVIADGHLLEGGIKPVVREGKVYAPLRAVFESLGWTVIWYTEGQTVTVEKKGAPQPNFLKTSIGYSQANFNGTMLPTEPPVLLDSQTYIAVSALQQLGLKTTWNESTHDLVVLSPPLSRNFEYADGRRYEGEMQNGLPNGKGRLLSKDGRLMYEGQFSFGLINGEGKLYDEQGRLLYAGTFDHERKQGYGRLYRQDGTVAFEGQFEDGKQTLSGREYGIDGTKWVPDSSGSSGIVIYPNGARFTGSFRDGAADGFGRLTALDGTPVVEGPFVKGSLKQSDMTVNVAKGGYYSIITRSPDAKAYVSPAHGITMPYPDDWLGVPIEVTEGPNKITFAYVDTGSAAAPFLTIKIYENAQWNEKIGGLPDGALRFRERDGLIYGFISSANQKPYEGKSGAEAHAAAFAKLAAGIDKALKFTVLSSTKLALTDDLFKGKEIDIWRRFTEIEQWTLQIAGAYPMQSILTDHDRLLVTNRLQQVYSPAVADDMFRRQNNPVVGGWQTIPIDYVSIRHIGADLKVKVEETSSLRTVTIAGDDVEVVYLVDRPSNKITAYKVIRSSI